MKKSINKRKLLTFIYFNLSALFLLLLYSNIQVLAQPIDPPGLEIAMDVQEANTPDLMSDPDVVGTAVGLNEKGRPVILVFTISGQARGIPRSLEGFPVVVKVTGEIFALHHKPGHSGGPGGGDGEDPPPPPEEGCDSTTARCRPAYIGVSTGHPSITAGTIGCRVTDGSDVYALSNNHVYADENSATIGDNMLQPGPFDGGIDPDDTIGTLDDFEPIVFSIFANNMIDAAIALSSTAALGNATLSDGYGTPKSATAPASINQKVKKYGRTTGLTKGRVTAINATVNIGYDSGVARFINQIIIEPGSFSAGGDSGSLIVVDGKGKNSADDRKPVGLLFAGSFFVTVANPIDPVLTRFGVTVDDE